MTWARVAARPFMAACLVPGAALGSACPPAFAVPCWLLWAFGVLALVDMALSIWQPGRPMVVATAVLEALVRLGAGSLLGGF